MAVELRSGVELRGIDGTPKIRYNNMQNMGLEHTRVFPLVELKDITDNFSEERVIGRGGSGVVYKGVLDNEEVIAVKKLHNHYDSSGNKLGNGEAQFLNELMNLIGVQHQNIIRLVGYCYETRNIVIECDGKRVLASEEERILCLEYMQGGSLKDHLSDESCGLDWQARFNIIKGVCEGLKYLHTGSEKPIYHLDLKPENIWLDGNMIPKIGGFGISRLPVGSMQTYATQNAVSGTIGYMAPEYISRNQISQKCDIYSLGVTMICVIAGEKGFQNYDPHSPSEEFIEHVHENWGKRQMETMSSHSLQQVKTCTEIALRCVEHDRVKRPTVTDIVDELNKIDAAESSAIGSQNTKGEEHATLEKQKGKGHLEDTMKEQVDGRTKNNLPTPVTMDLSKAAGVISAILSPPSRRIGSQEQYIQHSVHFQSDLQNLRDTLPAMNNLINGAEWKSHEDCVVEVLPKLKDAVYDADDLLDEFNWHEMKVQLEGNSTERAIAEFFDTINQGSFNKLTDVQRRLDHLSSQLEKMGLREVTHHFDKVARPETSSLPNEAKIFGRYKEIKQVMVLLSVPTSSKRKRASISVNTSTNTVPSNQLSNETRILSIPVLAILGIGGVGKTTLAQHICNQKEVKAHFEQVIWICVSDDFDVKRLTKEVLECLGKKETSDNLNYLQRALSDYVNNRRFLIVLDDMWDDALKENGQCWKRFCAPLKTAQEGSVMLVTTRCPKVVEGVCTLEPVILEGLNDDIFWNFFKLCVFGSESSNNDPELERIGIKILPKLKGSPLAAKTLGRMLRMDLEVSHWNSILESELWELKQEATDILPALRLSYMYLPFYLKRCFSFCAVYPKDYKFEKEDLAEVWVAEGFVETQGADSIQKTSCQYFQDLVTRSFFQKVRGGYVIHGLLHDMAQKVSEHDCFILRNKNDFYRVPLNVRHIFVHPSSDFDSSNLSILSRHAKLRTLICKKQSGSKTSSVMNNWCTKLLRIRVMSCASTNELPDSIGNLKHLRYLKISKGRPLSIPPTFSSLYNLQILDVRKCNIQSLPGDFSNLRHLQRFVSQGFSYNPVSVCHIDAAKQVQGVTLMKNLNQFRGDLEISNVDMLSKYHAAEAELNNKKYLYKLTLKWSGLSESQIVQHNAVEVLQVLQPPASIRSLVLQKYPGASLPSWLQPQMLNLNDSTGIFASLTDLDISWCENLSSLEHFLHPDYVPVINKIQLRNCKSLVSVPTERFGDLSFLEELDVDSCLNIRSQCLVSPSLKQLKLGDCGSLLDNIDCCSLTNFTILNGSVTSIQTEGWSLPALQELNVLCCESLTSIGVSTRLPLCAGTDNIRAFSKLNSLVINTCCRLSIIDGLLTKEYLPAIERIEVRSCYRLLSLLGERFGGLSSLKYLHVYNCSSLNWQTGLVLPSSLQTLELDNCGDFSVCVPGCLENLTSLVSLKMIKCQGLRSIPGTIWRSNLALLEELVIQTCPNLVWIGGAKAVANIKEVRISGCPKLQEAGQTSWEGEREIMEARPMVCYSTGTMNSLLDKLTNMMNNHSNPAEEFFKFLSKKEEWFYKLTGELKGILEGLKRDFLDKFTHRRETHRQVTVWMKQVRDLVFDIEDWIDLTPETYMGDPSMTQKFDEFKDKIREALDRCNRYHLLEKVPTEPDLAVAAPSKITTDPTLLVEERTCHGLFNDSRDTLQKHLGDDQLRLKVVSLVGMEGLGKTTLAKEIFANIQLQGHFECQAFVSVGRRPVMREILNDIFRQVNPQGLWTPEQGTIKLREYLSTKRYFIVLDGIWSTRAWKLINCALPANDLRSRVLATTCMPDIGKFCTGHPNDVVYQMAALSKENSRFLFLSRISPLEKERMANFEEVSGNMLDMCGGIPLAIIIAAGLFPWKSENLAESKVLGISAVSSLKQNFTSEGMEKILCISYFDLSMPMRSCFLYLGIFPEGYTIKKDRLIRLWGAEGFIPILDKECLWVTGEMYFNELISRGLIQPVFDYDDDQAVGCTVHSVTLGFIISLSRQENFATRAAELSSDPFPCDTIRRFSLNNMSNKDEVDNLSAITVHLSSMRSLTVLGDAEGMFDPPLSSYYEDDEEMHYHSVRTVGVTLLSFKLMRVLDLEETKNLSDRHLEGIGGLVLLRYLGLRGTGIHYLPREIGRLEQLETIDLRGNGEIAIGGATFKRFQKLVRLLGDILEMPDMDSILEMPELEEVSMVRAWGRNSPDKVAERLRSKRLRMLGVDLGIPENTTILSFLEEVVHCNLRSLSLNCSNYDDHHVCLLLDSWEKATAPPAVTFEPRRFELMFSGGGSLSALPVNMASLVRLTHLRIKLSKVQLQELGILGSLPNLVHLDLTSGSGSGIIKNGAFPCLKVLLFTCEFSGNRLEFEEGAALQLRRLRLTLTLAKWISAGHMDFSVKHLTCLRRVKAIINFRDATVSEVEAAAAHVRNQVYQNPNKPTFELSLTAF